VRTWPEGGDAAIDLFLCGNAEPRKALKALAGVSHRSARAVGIHKRGVI
jgi:S-adenosylmethionine decarboxylase